MSVLSIRFKRPSSYAWLKRRAAERNESASGLAERLIEEGLRMDAHPGIEFRDGPSGRRAALKGGPDVWEIATVLRELEGTPEERIERAAELIPVGPHRIAVASRYYAAYSEEIDREIEANEQATEREHELWLRERRLLGS